MLCVEVLKLNDQVLLEDWNYFMRGATGAQVDVPAKPDVPWLQQWQWNEACKLDAVLPVFKGFKDDIVTTPCWVKFGKNNVVSFIQQQEIRSVEHGICPIAEFTSPWLNYAAISAIRP